MSTPPPPSVSRGGVILSNWPPPLPYKTIVDFGLVHLLKDLAGPDIYHYLGKLRDEEGVAQEEWPSSSPDFNAIESVWTYMKDRVAGYSPKIKKVKELRSVLANEWEALQKKKNSDREYACTH